MILVDTSVWIDHFRRGDEKLVELLAAGQVLTHPLVLGELALSNLRQRELIISTLQDLPSAAVATDAEALRFIADHSLYGQGIGYIDAHLIAAARLTPGTHLWTRDRPLQRAATSLGLASQL